MHSSRMRTARFSGRLLVGLESAHGVSAVGCLPWGVCRGVSAVGGLPWGGLSWGVSVVGVYTYGGLFAQGCVGLVGVSGQGVCWGECLLGEGCLLYPLLKHYLFATVAVINCLSAFTLITVNYKFFRVK